MDVGTSRSAGMRVSDESANGSSDIRGICPLLQVLNWALQFFMRPVAKWLIAAVLAAA